MTLLRAILLLVYVNAAVGQAWAGAPTIAKWGVDRTTTPWSVCMYDKAGACQPFFTLPPTGGGAAVLPAAIPLASVPQHVASNAALMALPSSALAYPVRRDGFAFPGDGGAARYVNSGAACAISGGDGGSQIPASNGTCEVLDAATPLTPEIFGAATAGDETAAVQAAITASVPLARPLHMSRSYSVSHILISAGGTHIVSDGASLIGNATTATSSVLESTVGVMTIDGLLTVSGNYDMNYGSGFWWHASTQYSFVRNLSVNSTQVCWKLGDTAAPSALISEATIAGGSTYGCPIAAQIIGTETDLTIVGAQWSSDNFGVPSAQASAWAALPHRGIQNIGATVNFNGGELIMAGITTGALTEDQPLTGANGEGTVWGRLSVSHAITETASPLAIATNPNNLTINSTYHVRGLMLFDSLQGFHSQNTAPFITTSADFDGEIVARDNSFFYPGTRTQANVSAGSVKTDVYVDDRGFGTGFEDPIAGTVGGTVHFSKRPVLVAQGLNGQSVAANAAGVLLFKNVNSTGSLARFSADYNPATGMFTVPPDGLKSVTIRARVQFRAQPSATLYVSDGTNGRNGIVGVGGTSPAGAGSVGETTFDATFLAPGRQIKIIVATTKAGGAATASTATDIGNQFVIEASN